MKFVMYPDKKSARSGEPIAIVIANDIDDAFSRLREEAIEWCKANTFPIPDKIVLNGYKVIKKNPPCSYSLKCACYNALKAEYVYFKVLTYTNAH